MWDMGFIKKFPVSWTNDSLIRVENTTVRASLASKTSSILQKGSFEVPIGHPGVDDK